MNDAWYREFRTAVDAFATLFVILYHHLVKIKFHHLMHLPEDLRRLGLVLSCFVLERKHRDWKRLSLFAFRSVEHSSVTDFVNYSVQEFCSGRFKFQETYLLQSEAVVLDGVSLCVSWSAVLRVGIVKRSDIVIIMFNGVEAVGRVVRFFDMGGDVDITVEIECFAPLGGGDWSTLHSTIEFVPATAVRHNAMWASRRHGVIHVLRPPVLL